MGIDFEVFYHPLVKKVDILSLDSAVKQRIKKAIEQKLMSKPEVFGVPLRHSRQGDRKLRVGDYRIVFRIVGKRVNIHSIQHRSIVY
jgi:mRNA interferase RelE/StbE